MQSEMPAPGSYEPFRLKEKIGEKVNNIDCTVFP